ncbi:MAG: winged helix-turn-helix transcriptional regulator [Rhodospirillaceae bacterium]|nr:winged helix-turn-helix transcriptional regulator [Rhodospirillaceae bacterium]
MDSFSALSDPTRRRILALLGPGEQPAGAIAAQFDLSAPAISQHLKALREAGLVRVRVDGQRRIYSLDPTGLAEMDDWFANMRQFWSSRLDDLERALREEDGRRKTPTKGNRK